MTDREFVFSDPAVQRLIREKFIPLAMDDWYLRRQKDAQGKFFMEMTRESPRGNAGEGTRQGRYVFTAGGKFLGFNNNRSPERLLAMLRETLERWEKLAAADRAVPGDLGDVVREARYERRPPAGGAVVKVYTRVLERGADGALRAVSEPERKEDDFRHRGLEAAVDHLWLTAEDLKALVPAADAPVGVAMAVPRAIGQRVARYHLVDGTRGEPPHWSREEVKRAEFSVIPEGPGRAKLKGRVWMETVDGKRGFEGEMEGEMGYGGGRLERFEAVVIGEHWGESPLTAGARPGRSPLGFAFRLSEGKLPADVIPPQAARWLDGYYEPDRN